MRINGNYQNISSVNFKPVVSSPKSKFTCDPKDTGDTEGINIGRGIHGLDCYPVNAKTAPELEKWRRVIDQKAKQYGLDPFDVSFWVMERDTLLEATARSGFPVRYRHWSFGQAYQELYLPQKHGLSKLYELVINNDPSYAYLLKENPLYAQKLVMAHVMGHSDFFKNNIMFCNTYRKMLNRMSDHAAGIDRILNTKNVTSEEIEKFIDKVHSIQWLIDLSSNIPRELNSITQKDIEIEKVPKDWGVIDTTGLPSHLEKRLNDPERLIKEREEERKKREEQIFKIPPEADRDILAFLIENSTVLKGWQRQVLAIIRNESYYFAPQLHTKIMNEGWATYWHNKLTLDPELLDLEHTTNIEKMNANVLALNKFRINPYALGFEIFKDIERRYDKGRYGAKWESITDSYEKENYDNKEMNGKEKIFEVRKLYNDPEFIRTFFTPAVARNLKMYTWDPVSRESDDLAAGREIVISSKEFQKIKDRLLQMLENGGQPLIQVIDGNFANKGELRLEHIHSYDLKQDWAGVTLENIKSMWGKPVHLDTFKTVPSGFKKPMRISVVDDGGKNLIKRHILKENGDIDYECDVNGKPLNEPKKKATWPYASL